jgi:hypothetical protein
MIPRPVRRRRVRLRFRHPLPYWLAVGVLAAVTAATLARVTDAAASERERWGERMLVAVALVDAGAGEAVTAELREVPVGLVPEGALTVLPDGDVASAWIGAGEVVLEQRLAPAGLSPAAAMLPAGTRGVAVPVGIAPLPVAIGDRVDVLGPALLAAGALVVAVTDDAVTVAVPGSAARRVADVVVTGTVTLVLSSAE